ncbi:conserved hypothetical protein [Candidatus Nitrotoga sp. HW29]|uniref:hypothetical protein n=1 Tax=Candidatus Nitrotoga sp. HW29 TaxID=2886963 RepID=UPI001EF2CA5E|nr:hypothetical protein [Candidatus Nitrotoga sp. HW29]CAH1905569.1 conserved hypothetical protein [Candidatus Nitrotoga sp. HW29]
MSYKVTRDQDSCPSISLTDEPPYVHTLVAVPAARESELNTDNWLVMACAVWSTPDNLAIQTALDVAKHYGGKLNLGLRPFDDTEELGTWCPGLEDSGQSPLWVLLRDGEVCMQRSGILTVDELVEVIGDVCDRFGSCEMIEKSA